MQIANVCVVYLFIKIGVLVVILFFIILILVISTSFVVFASQKKKDVRGTLNNNHNHRKISTLPLTMPIKHYHSANGPSPPSTLMHVHPPLRDQNSLGSHHHHPPPPPPVPMSQHSHGIKHAHPHGHGAGHPMSRPDLGDSPGAMGAVSQRDPPPNAMQRAVPPAPPSHSFSMLTGPSDNYSEILAAAEQYDLENASSIAPSDIDGLAGLAYHYKGFPRDSQAHNRHVPLARLSPSVSELTAPRILTLHDLSPSGPPCLGQPAPPATKSKAACRPPAVPVDSSDDANSVDSFTSSELDQTYHYLK